LIWNVYGWVQFRPSARVTLNVDQVVRPAPMPRVFRARTEFSTPAGILKYVRCPAFITEMSTKLQTAYILRRLAELRMEAFGDREFARLFGLTPARARRVLHRLASGGFLKRLANGRYVVAAFGASAALAQPFYLGTRLVEPSYVSFWSALHYYGWTEQAARLVFIANTRLSLRRNVEPYAFRLVKLSAMRFFGSITVRDGPLEFPVAEPEKALVDSLYLPDHAGGMEHVASALAEALDTLDRTRLVAYAVRMGERSLASRLGYLLDRNGVEGKGLAEGASKVYVRLDPEGPRRGRFIAKWRVIDNLAEATG